MKIISHRGNLDGPNKLTENKIETIENVLNLGFDCEIDVWYINSKLWLGHDYAENEIDINFLIKNCNMLWIHCKNIEALILLKHDFNCFFHDKDVYTLTSKGYIWGNIESRIYKEIVQVMPEVSNMYLKNGFAVCTDYPKYYKSL
jgi:hypothetical protein